MENMMKLPRSFVSAQRRLTAMALTKRPAQPMALKKSAGAKEIVVELGLCAISVGLLLLFRTQIGSLITTLMGTASTSISGMFDAVTG